MSGDRPTPVIMMTSGNLEVYRKKAAEAGAEEFLPKPIDPEALLAAVKRVLIANQARLACFPGQQDAGEGN